MKSFSVKALVVALVVVGSVNANGTDAAANTGFVATVKGYASSAKNSVANAVSYADVKIFGGLFLPRSADKSLHFEEYNGLPVFRSLKFESPYARAVVVASAAAVVTGAAVAVRAAYKHFTKPAIEAAEGEENVEAAQ